MTSLTAGIRIGVTADLKNALDLTTAESAVNYLKAFALADGVGAGQAKSIFTDTRSLAASASEDLDLSGVLTSAFGTAITFTKIKALIIVAAAANVNDIVAGNTASNGCFSFFNASTDALRIKPGGAVALVAPDANGYAVTAGTADLLKILNGGAGTPVSYDIIIIGV
jgi:hypothetical protein